MRPSAKRPTDKIQNASATDNKTRFTVLSASEQVTREKPKLNQDLQDERQRVQFNVELFTTAATTAGKIALAHHHIEARKKTYSSEEAANQTGVELLRVAELHCQSFLLQSTIEMVEKSNVPPQIADVFRDILELYAVDLAIRCLGDLLQFVNITSTDVEQLQQRMESALKTVRKSALGIVDGFDIPDYVLSSTLGAYDGNVYERLLEAAKKSPLNQEDVNQSFHLYLKPFIKSNL